MTGKKPLLLIDDLLSELDIKHEHMLLEKMKYYQIFISSIDAIEPEKDIKL
jgi:recombinational DNA repair ATPase RecF